MFRWQRFAFCTVTLVALTSCSSDSDSTTEVNELRQEIATLSTRVSALNGTNVTQLQSQVTAVETTTASNTVATGLNGTGIDSNGASIATNAAAISSNATSMATHVSTLASNSAAIDTNATGIATDATDISTNAGNISTNTTDIATNTSAISTNAGNTATNTSAISTNAAAIASSTTNISTNTTDIASFSTTLSDYDSCLDILDNNPSASDGYYVIRRNTVSFATYAPQAGYLTVWCDMADGGWTVIDFQDFEDGTATGWSDQTVDTTSNCVPVYTAMLGGRPNFGTGASTSRAYALYGIPHTAAHVTLDFIGIDSWDLVQNEEGVVSFGGSVVWSEVLIQGGANLCGEIGPSWPEPGAYAVDEVVSHTANAITLTATSTLNQQPTDESWGIDNVRVRIR